LPYGLLADAVLLAHAAFVAFVVLGGLLVLRWPRLAWVHLPVVAWGAGIEFAGGICPLTPLENHLRALAQQQGYAGGFVEHLLRLTDDALTGWRRRHLAGAALEDLRAEFLLEFLDRDRKGGLADEAGLGRTTKMALARHCNDVLELGERHSCAPSGGEKLVSSFVPPPHVFACGDRIGVQQYLSGTACLLDQRRIAFQVSQPQ